MTAMYDDPHIGLVVEGRGDHNAVPLLLRRHMQSREEYRDVLGKPVPVHGRGNATVETGIEGYVATAGRRPGCRGVVVILDGDDDCVAELGPSLLQRSKPQVGVPVVVALAVVEYEDWLYASAETLELPGLTYQPARAGQMAIAEALKPRKYVKPTWQPRLTARMDIDLAVTRSGSLERALRKFDALLDECLS